MTHIGGKILFGEPFLKGLLTIRVRSRNLKDESAGPS